MSAPSVAPPWVAKVPFVGADVTAYWSKYTEDGKRMLNQLEKEVKVPPRPKIVIEGEEGITLQEPPPVPADENFEEKKTDETTLASENFVAIFGKFLTWAWGWLLSITLAVGSGVTQLVLSGFLAFFLLRDAPILSDRLAVAADRLAGSRGLHLVKVAGDTVRGVIYGIIGTAIAQALLAGIGFWFAGIPGAILLGVVTFFFGVVPFGPPLVWLPAAAWLFAQGHTGMGIFMLIWGAGVISGIDNVLKPYLISQGSKMPFVLIFCGVIGGAFAFGLVGVFLGPTLLAVAFRVIEEWSSHRAEPEVELTARGSSVLIKEVASGTQLHGGESLGVR
ncbi:MAG: AI-2E family transporter [Akkermansiaceae bacterium]|nr:AI-2E family transporter [Akkermansiaceae bacterium]